MTDLATRIADVKKKAEAAKEALNFPNHIALNADEATKVWQEFAAAASPDFILAMAARIEELEKALEPFANEWDWNCAPRQTGGPMDHPDYDREFLDEDHSITYGHLRTAARALKGETP